MKTQATATMKVAETKKIDVATDPVDATDSAAVLAAAVWTSSDEAIATVATDGTITAVAAGKATITVTSNALTANTALTVNAADAA